MFDSEICYNNNNNSQFVTHFCETIERSFGWSVWRGLNLETMYIRSCTVCVCERVFFHRIFFCLLGLYAFVIMTVFFSLTVGSLFCYEIFFLTVWFRRNWLRLHLLFTKHLPRHKAFSAIDSQVFFLLFVGFSSELFWIRRKTENGVWTADCVVNQAVFTLK